MIIFAFDTETTGLINFNKKLDDECQPNLVQIAWIVEENDRVVNSFSGIIKQKSIPEEATRVHGITNEMSNRFGLDIEFVLQDFLKWYEICNLVVAHNFDFDRKIVEIAISKSGMNCTYPARDVYDTMKKSTDLLKLPGKFEKFKWPKLMELHKYLFRCEFEGSHDALDDVRATLKCYKELMKVGIQ